MNRGPELGFGSNQLMADSEDHAILLLDLNMYKRFHHFVPQMVLNPGLLHAPSVKMHSTILNTTLQIVLEAPTRRILINIH
mmetsp:Transcript_25577/g.36700  ORF Transcript_25577/g.36700 Transcript_25577/m.36700 type:complete len:81 (+) Transcript_25577:355-597(+)